MSSRNNRNNIIFDVSEDINNGNNNSSNINISNTIGGEDGNISTRSSSGAETNTLYHDTIAQIKVEHGFLVECEKKHLEKRSKSFELLRLLEDCTRYHNAECQRELKQGKDLYQEVYSEFHHRRDGIDTPIYSYSVRRFLEKYINEYNQHKMSDGASFPWSSYDETMEKNCMGVLATNQLLIARSYLVGYMEVICRVPNSMLSNQGKVTFDSASWAINRHPFSLIMSIFRIVLSLLTQDVYKETITIKTFKGIIDNFVLICQQTWSICWGKCAKVSNDLPELLIESIQHCLFLHCQYLPRLLYGENMFKDFNSLLSTSSSSLSSSTSDLTSHSFDLIELRQPLKLSDLYRLCGVPEKYHIYPAFSESSSAYQYVNQPTISPEEMCWLSISENPFLALRKEISILRHAKTPAEVADVATSILKALIVVSKRNDVSMSNTDGTSNTTTLSSSSSSSQQKELSADEMIPLLTFSFALYFRTPVRQNHSQFLRYQNPNDFISLLKFAEAYLPNHLSVREEGYSVAMCLSAIQTLPM